MDRIDFRSDTVTWPTEAMREAMAGARVGDDVYGEDPTILELEEKAASMVGKEAGLFVASGTMGNLVAILTLATRGDEAIVGLDTHTFTDEAGGMAVLGGIMPRPLPTDDLGCMSLEDIAASIRPDDPHYPRSRLILLENSYGAKNGAPIPVEYFASVREVGEKHGLKIHLDGARFFNAVTALKIPARELAQHVDTVSFCLSKGLCAPVGSILCGSSEFIRQARRTRKVLGGGMRQAGVLAAAGLVGLREMVGRLAEDHDHAQFMARGLSEIPGIIIDAEAIKTNIVFFQLADSVPFSAAAIARILREESDIWIGVEGERLFRVVTHYWIGRTEVAQMLEALATILSKGEYPASDETNKPANKSSNPV